MPDSTLRFPQVRLVYGSPAPNRKVQGCHLIRVVSEPADSASKSREEGVRNVGSKTATPGKRWPLDRDEGPHRALVGGGVIKG